MAVSKLITSPAHPPDAELRKRTGHNSHGSLPWPRRTSCIIWGHVKATVISSHFIIHIQEPDLPRLLAKSVVQAENATSTRGVVQTTRRLEGTSSASIKSSEADSPLQLEEPSHEVVTIGEAESDHDATEKVRDAVRRTTKGQHGKKVLLKLERPAD